MPRLILMDLQLPDIDGLELTRRLKADPGRRGIIVLALTAYATKGDDEKSTRGRIRRLDHQAHRSRRLAGNGQSVLERKERKQSLERNLCR